MLVLKIIVCILIFIAVIFARMTYGNNINPTRTSFIAIVIAGILVIIFGALLIATNCNWFIIPKISLLISVCLYILFKEYGETCDSFMVGIFCTSIAFVVTSIMYNNNFRKCETPDISITRNTIVCAKDNSSVTGNVFGNILYVHGSISEQSMYKYYYLIEDGGIKQGSIPANSTTIYFVKPGEKAYLETIVTTEYWLNNNNTPATRCRESSNITYKLYVPEGSVTDVYEFNAE